MSVAGMWCIGAHFRFATQRHAPRMCESSACTHHEHEVGSATMAANATVPVSAFDNRYQK